MDKSTFKPDNCEIPDNKKGTALLIEYGYEPMTDNGCNHHFAKPNSDSEFATECTTNESHPISWGTTG